MDFSNGNSGGFDDRNVNNTNLYGGFEGLNEECDAFKRYQSFYSCDGTSHENVNPNASLSDNERSIEIEKTKMLETADAAMRELIELININEPLWAKCLDDMVGFVLVPERYASMFPRVTYLENPKEIHIESSKDSKILSIGGMQLVEMILDSEKWANAFPTIVSEAKTIKVFDVGSMENRSGALQLMDAEVNISLPLVPRRKFSFLRYCQQVNIGTWVIADVSPAPFGAIVDAPWRRPSGCMIREMSYGTSMVTWVEHAVVDDRVYKNKMYRPFICRSIAHGARKWLSELERKCEKIICTSVDYVPMYNQETVKLEGRETMMNLSSIMVRRFCSALSLESRLLQIIEEGNPNEPSVLVHHNLIQFYGTDRIVVTCITSVWLPISPHILFHFLNDDDRRHQWDPYFGAKPTNKIAHITIGATDSYTSVSIIQTFNQRDDIVSYLKEGSIDTLGAYVIYAPITEIGVNEILNGCYSSTTPLIPSGFMISQDSRAVGEESSIGNIMSPGGSLLTMAFQMLNFEETIIPNTEHVVLSTIQKIKAAYESGLYH